MKYADRIVENADDILKALGYTIQEHSPKEMD
jgi:hypothetical protein